MQMHRSKFIGFIMAGVMLFTVPVWADETAPPTEQQTMLEKAGVSQSIQDQVTIIIQKSISVAEKTGEFLEKEVPDVVKQFLLWKFYEAVFWSVFALFVTIFGVGLGSWLVYKDVTSWESGGAFAAGGVIAILFGAFGLTAITQNAMIALQIYIAPKVYLLEWAAQHIK